MTKTYFDLELKSEMQRLQMQLIKKNSLNFEKSTNRLFRVQRNMLGFFFKKELRRFKAYIIKFFVFEGDISFNNIALSGETKHSNRSCYA